MRSTLSCTTGLLVLIVFGFIHPSECKWQSKLCDTNQCTGNALEKPACCTDDDDPKRIAEAFQKFGFIPQIIPRPPKQLFVGRFPRTQINLGNYIDPFSIGFPPQVSFEGDPKSLYTLIFLNVDSNYPYYGTYEYLILSLLVVNIPGGDWTAGDYLLSFQPHLPIPGYGPERYCSFVYKQDNRIEPTLELKRRTTLSSNKYAFKEFAKNNSFGEPVAGNFFISSISFCNTSLPAGC